MFNLIVAVISIALIAAMAAASIFYGGEAFSESTAQAQASTLVNNGQQISGAQQLHQIDNSGNRETAIGNLVSENYLQAVPTPPASVVADGTDWTVSNAGQLGVISLVPANSTAVCDAIVEQGGAKVDFTTAEVDYAGAITVADLPEGAQFGCFVDVNSVDGQVAFAYKL